MVVAGGVVKEIAAGCSEETVDVVFLEIAPGRSEVAVDVVAVDLGVALA